METAKVDIRKLQLLNDRINQCIDALSQVRLSVHGLSHTQANSPFGVAPQAGGLGFGASPFASPFGGGAQTAGWIGPGFAGGLAHTPFAQAPMAGFSPGVGGNFPLLNQLNQLPFGNVPIGLSHTGLEGELGYNRPLWADPFLVSRLTQTFPYAQLPMPPFVPVY
jgi:hypothetical protein